ncbi:hypothetical protein RBEAN4_0421 [Rickettsia bellii str. RML An4]|uniref:Uncharacterized protein n=1 Tax=Rickettsia bellii str. RML An4 TaxID=1359193 RepID=A0A0F3QA58_RICBE|nr:hypothetical protein RBEAN4_0421 [Rickettsia bellii str. RML An4]
MCVNFIEQNFPSKGEQNDLLNTTNFKNSILDSQNDFK